MLPVELVKKLTLDHIVLVVSDITKTHDFYSKILGEPESLDDDQIVYTIGATKFFLALPWGDLIPGDKFNANRIGLEHLAFGVESIKDLQEIEAILNEAEIKHSGIHIDKHSNKEKIWLDDPDGIRVEFYYR